MGENDFPAVMGNTPIGFVQQYVQGMNQYAQSGTGVPDFKTKTNFYSQSIIKTINYLEDCYKSLLAQTYKDFKIIFIDDGSTDGSISFLEKLSDFDSRFT